MDGEETTCFFQTAETGKQTPNSSVKGSGANHYPRAPTKNKKKLQQDSRVVLFRKYANRFVTVRVRSLNSDVFFILSHIIHVVIVMSIHFDTGNNTHLTDLVSGFSQEFCTALMALRAFTYCDSTSAFKGIWKIKPIKTMQTNHILQPMLTRLGKRGKLQVILAGFEAFKKCVLKNDIINSRKNVDLNSRSPCQKAFA